MSAAAANLERMPDAERRAMLLDVPNVGKVRQRYGRVFIDFSPELRDGSRYLWTFFGKAFESPAAAELVRSRICQDAATMPLIDAVARYRGRRSRNHSATDVIDRYLEAAKTTPSDRTGLIVRPRTLAAYGAVLRRARPALEGLTIAEATRSDYLRQLKGWFRVPVEQGGRGLQSDQEARNFFAAFRAVIAWYRTTRSDFPAPDWPPMPTALTAKRRNLARQAPRQRLSLPEVVRAIDAIPEKRQPFYWALFYTQARPTEVRGVLGEDWARPRLRIRRSAEGKSSSAAIAPTTKTEETGAYELPDWVGELIDRHCTGARFDPSSPLFRSTDPRAAGPLLSDDAIRDTWASACERAGVPFVSVYRAFKHTQVSALRDAGISIEDIVDQCRWTSASMLEHYDDAKDVRRGAVVARLDELVGTARRGYVRDTPAQGVEK